MAPTYDEDGTQTNSISESQQRKKSNILLDSAEKHLTREDNISPAATFIKNQKRLLNLKKRLKTIELMNS